MFSPHWTNILTLVSSVQITLFQNSCGLFRYNFSKPKEQCTIIYPRFNLLIYILTFVELSEQFSDFYDCLCHGKQQQSAAAHEKCILLFMVFKVPHYIILLVLILFVCFYRKVYIEKKPRLFHMYSALLFKNVSAGLFPSSVVILIPEH